jgi:acetyl-CoA carboxylase carboxyl transferase subunit alpha
MNPDFLDFEQPIADLQAKIEELKHLGSDSEINIAEEIRRLQTKSKELTQSIFSSLKPYQIVQLARHPQRPHFTDYIDLIFTDFDEQKGDGHYNEGNSIIGGTARLNGKPVMLIGHEKGRSTKEKIKRNFGMPRPEDYRKAKRLMLLAEKFSLPIFTFIDTPGAYPGIGAEERNQSEAIARNLWVMSELKVPVICTVTGEGGSGGALAIGVGDKVLMLQYSIYSVISPEGCASILWKSAEKAKEAAEAMKVTAQHAKKYKLIDEIISEPLGGAHRDPKIMANTLKSSLSKQLNALKKYSLEQLLKSRYDRLSAYGASSKRT